MKKALFIPFENKKDDQISQDMAMSGQERIDKMFELIDFCLATSKHQYLKPLVKDHFIVLKRHDATSKGPV